MSIGFQIRVGDRYVTANMIDNKQYNFIMKVKIVTSK